MGVARAILEKSTMMLLTTSKVRIFARCLKKNSGESLPNGCYVKCYGRKSTRNNLEKYSNQALKFQKVIHGKN